MWKYLIDFIYFLFVLIFSGISVQAQNTFRSELAIGGSAGAGFSTVSFRPKVTQNTLIGYHGGASVRWITEKNLGLQLEINFTQKGWKEAIDLTDDDESPSITNPFYIRKMRYMEIPLFTHIYFGSDKARFFVNMGPQIGFFVHESTDQNLNGAAMPNRPHEQHSMPVEKKFEWGIGGGPGVELRSDIGFFLLEGRYYYGLSDFYNTRRGDAFSRAANQTITVKLTYFVPLWK